MSKKIKNFLDVVPERIREARKREDGTISILYPRFPWPFIQNIFSRWSKNPCIQIHLDRLGSYVWESIDGKKTVYEIGKEVCNKLGEKEEDLWYQRMAFFIQILYRRDLIKLKREFSSDS